MWQICPFKLWAKTMGKLCKRQLLRKSWRSYGWKPWKLTAGEIVGVDGEARHRRRRKNHSRGVQIALQRGRKMRKTSGRGQKTVHHQKISVIKSIVLLFYCRINYMSNKLHRQSRYWFFYYETIKRKNLGYNSMNFCQTSLWHLYNFQLRLYSIQG